MLISQRGVARL